jgi:hypothetical protein
MSFPSNPPASDPYGLKTRGPRFKERNSLDQSHFGRDHATAAERRTDYPENRRQIVQMALFFQSPPR